MPHINGVMFNWSAALGAWALGGPMWGALVFVTVAFLRVWLDSQALRERNAELERLLAEPGTSFAATAYEAIDEPEAPPESETRPSQVAIARARLASGG